MRSTRPNAASRKRWLIALLGLIGGCCTARAQDVIFIANIGVQISTIRASDLHAIFTGEKTRLADGTHVVPVILKGGPVHEVFLKNYCAESPNEFRAQWQKAVFTGQGSMPKAFDSEAALIEYVAQTAGAVGYVSRFSPHDGVKALTALK
jgi:hypothetical protein